jgi:hypothetical protein
MTVEQPRRSWRFHNVTGDELSVAREQLSHSS